METPETLPATMRGTLAIPEADDENELVTVREQFAVTDFKSALWVANKIKAARGYGAAVMEWAKREKAKADEAEEFYLSAYGDQMKALVQETTADVKRKHLELPGTRLQLKKAPVNLKIENEALTKEWAVKEYPEFVQITATVKLTGVHISFFSALRKFCERSGLGDYFSTSESLDRAAITGHFKATGELPPGCEITGGDEKIYVQ